MKGSREAPGRVGDGDGAIPHTEGQWRIISLLSLVGGRSQP